MPIGFTGNNKKLSSSFAFSRNFKEIQGTVSLLCAHPLMTNINFFLEDPTLKKTSVTYLIFMFGLIFIFRILISRKATSSHLSISHLDLCTKAFRGFRGQ